PLVTPPPFSMLRRAPPPPPTLFPYTTLFRSCPRPLGRHGQEDPEYPRGRRRVPLRHAVLWHQAALRHAIRGAGVHAERGRGHDRDRKSTRLNSSHVSISYAVFCLKKKKTT